MYSPLAKDRREEPILAQLGGLEDLLAGGQQNVEHGALAVAEHQVLAHGGAQSLVDDLAGLHGHGGLVVHPAVFDAQGVQQVVAADLLGKPVCSIGRTSKFQFHGKIPLFFGIFHSIAPKSKKGNKKSALPDGTVKLAPKLK